MPWTTVDCKEFDAERTTYDSGNYVCTVNPVVEVGNDYYQFVWRCGSEQLCNGVAPAEGTAWFLTRNKGKITDFESADYYEYELDLPYAYNEIVMFLDRMYSCIDNRGNCGFYEPGTTFDTFTFDNYEIFYPWTDVTDKNVGDRIFKNETIVQPCLNYTAALDEYEAMEEPLQGFHYFITDEYACVNEFAWKCVDTVLCNSVHPDDDVDMTAWLMQPIFAEYIIADPPIVNCTYYDVETLNLEFIPRYITDNIICDIRVKTEIKTNTCNKLYEGGIYCNNYNMEALVNNQCTAEEVEIAWDIFNYGNELLMLRKERSLLWWDLDSVFPAEFTQDGYEWEAAVDLHSKRYWLFEFDDIAWQYHGDEGRTEIQLAFVCIDEA
jgi:hypothetical protein